MKLIVYTKPVGCQACRIMKKWLRGRDIFFEERLIEEYRDELLEAGFTSSPVVELLDDNGEELVKFSGFSEQQLKVTEHYIREEQTTYNVGSNNN